MSTVREYDYETMDAKIPLAPTTHQQTKTQSNMPQFSLTIEKNDGGFGGMCSQEIMRTFILQSLIIMMIVSFK